MGDHLGYHDDGVHMSQGFPIARIAGIRIRAHWSVLLICGLLAWGLADGLVPVAVPRTPELLSWTVSVAAALVLLASLTAHEVAHSLVARRLGLPVDGITLWVFGGVSQIRGDLATARTEIAVAVVGPAVTLVLTGVFFGASAALAAAGAPGLVVLAAEWLAGVNLLLLVFNLVPAFPLDGGRILRGILWARRGDRSRATIAAARAGRVFAFLLVALGLVDFFATSDFGGVWLVFIGWFLASMARGEQRGETVRRALEDVRVRDVMSTNPIVVPSWITVRLLLEQYAMRYPYTAFPTHGLDGKVDGLVTLLGMKRVPPRQRGERRASEISIPIEQLPIARPDDLVTDLFSRMSSRGAGRALVFDGEQLVGIVSPSDVGRRLQVGTVQPPAAARRPESPPVA